MHYVYETDCDTEVDRGDAFNYVAHRLNFLLRSLFWDIESFFTNLFYNLKA